LCIFFCYSSVASFLTVYSQEINLVEAATFFYIVFASVIFFSRPFIGRMFDARDENIILKEQIEEVLSTINPREKRVIQLRFGLEDGRNRTLEEVGKEFNVTRERIRQIESKALRKLRHPSRSRKLRDYFV
jgi:hypothetical protein